MKLLKLAILALVMGALVGVWTLNSTSTTTSIQASSSNCAIDSDCFKQKMSGSYTNAKNIAASDFVYVPPAVQNNSRQTKVTYVVTTRGAVTADVQQFKAQANETLNSSLGWARMGVSFSEVASGGDFTLVLSEASKVPTFGAICDSQYSCNVGRYVIINQDRWLGATTAWNSGGGTLRDYRHMVVNHETGHWLGHGHKNCSGAGNKAAVMQQQSISLQGCVFNPWPLDSELWSSRLGI